MINLLPEEKKKELKKRYRLRIAIVVLFLLAILLVIANIVIASLYFVAWQDKTNLIIQQETLLEGQDPQIQENENTLAVLKERVQILESADQEVFPTRLIEAAVRAKGEGIAVDTFIFKSDADNALTVNGTARDRDALIAFLDALRAQDEFSDASSPISNLSERTDISFTAQLKLQSDSKD